ncbi:MAG: hypothetical protein COB15_04275 [Flavobacteriales bacterium]|nr:MAG: hypothetical protein COB15_04275 [Flavobacteriales bacterium]
MKSKLHPVFFILLLASVNSINTASAQCNPFVGFTYTDNGNGSYSFTDVSVPITGPIQSWLWNFGDVNSTNSTQNPTYFFSANGNWPVTLIVTDSAGCIDTLMQYVNVTYYPCNVSFTTTDNGNGNYSFASTSNNTSSNEFKFGDGDSSLTVNANHTYTTNGTYIVTFISFDTTFCISMYYDTLVVTSATPCNLTASFTSTDNGGGNYTFTSTVTNGSAPYTYFWDFDGSITSTLTNPSYTYLTNGIYNPTLIVIDSNNCTFFYNDTIIVTSATPCNLTASFISTDNGSGNYSFNSTVNNGTTPYTYSWNFNDGNTSTLANPSNTYTSNGWYNPTLVVTDSNGCIHTSQDLIIVSSSTPCSVTASFTSTNNGNGNYSFTNSSTGNISAHYWNFGDGTTSNAVNPTHNYVANGLFVVSLYTVDSAGICADNYYQTIQVSGINTPVVCNASFVIIPDTSSNGNVFVFNTTVGNNLTYLWNFGDGNTSTQQFPNYSYNSTGPFNLCLTVTDTTNGGTCVSTYCDSITAGGYVFKTGFTISVIAPSITTSINEAQETILEFNVYPNPFKNEVTIELNATEQTQTEIFVTDLIGNRLAQISSKILNSGNNKLNWKANEIANGVYLLNIRTDNSLQVKKLILNR